MFRQLLISVVVLVAAAAGWIYFVPGAHDTLAQMGINVPFGPGSGQATADVVSAPADATGQRPGQAAGGGRPGGRNGGGGGAGGFGGNRQSVVAVSPVAMATINDKLSAIGNGVAARALTVTTAAGGTLEDLSVAPGAVVKAGDVIAHLDARSEQIDFEKATLGVKDATDALNRAQQLAKSNSATPVQVSTAQTALENAKLALRTAQLALEKRSIVTPIGGSVGLIQVTPGNYVNAQTPVTTINDTSTVLVSFSVPERYASAIKVGMPLSATAVALPGEAIAGMVTAIDNKVDAASRTLDVQGSIPNPKGELRPGMSFAVQLSFPGQQLPAVDPLAIQWSAKGAFVWKYADGKIHQTMVTIIQRNSDGVLVEGPLVAGDNVVTQGVQQLAEGQSVRLLDDKGPAAGGNPAGGDRQGATPAAAATPKDGGQTPDKAPGRRRPAGQSPA